MKFSVNWLREFVELPSTVEELAELLTLAGIEIERIEKRGATFDKVGVAQITASSQHPNADRLSVCQVDDGSGQTRQIVCGAKNYKVGDKVPLALPGAVLANDLKIKSNKLRGVESEGMLCSGKELALSEESDGLLILSPDAKIGAPIGSLFPDDTILDVEITPNRGDLLSHFGLAREISALVGQPLRLPNQATAGGAPALQKKGVKISAPRDCPFYSARRIENVTVGPSPDWLRAKLETVGLRSINNIVDITNFVMLEIGQPLHAFDADKLTGGITVRLANENEKFLALDGKTYSLGRDNLAIADDARAVGIAGVMGGEDTGVTETTKNVLLESAYFRSGSIRRTARKLNLPSDSSYRFERGVDPAMILPASQRATELIRELAAGNPSPEIATAGELPTQPKDVSLRYERCACLIGLAVPKQRVEQVLEGFGLKKTRISEDETLWRIPSYRSDLQREADLIEEVVRVFGIERVPGRDRSRFTPESEADRIYDFESALRRRLVGLGLYEARTSTLISRAEIPSQGAVELTNPLSDDHVALRPILLPGLLKVLVRNLNWGARSIRLFEIGRIFLPPDAAERCALGIVLSGPADRTTHRPDSSKRQLDFFDMKGVIEALAVPSIVFRRRFDSASAVSYDIMFGNAMIGLAWLFPATRATELGAVAPVFVAQVDVDSIREFAKHTPRFSEVEKYPAVSRDIAMIVPEKLSHVEIMAAIEGAREPLLTTIELFDLFSGKEAAGLGAGKKSLAYTLTYRDKTRTLTNDEITVVHAKIRERLQRELGVELRE
ncbi:MAG TPA: phenylalanine--tRNA ligase subunit beta [Chthoniobacterales bacterium]